MAQKRKPAVEPCARVSKGQQVALRRLTLGVVGPEKVAHLGLWVAGILAEQ